MNREECAALLPVMVAFAEGKPIQARTADKKWQTLEDEVSFNADSIIYRIKPEKQERWVTLYKGAGFPTLEEAQASGREGYEGEHPIAIIRIEYTPGEGL